MPRYANLLAVCVTAASGCAMTVSGVVGDPSPAAAVAEQLARSQAIRWSDRRLTWGDFKGRPGAEAGLIAAQTASTLIHAVRCAGSNFEFSVVAAIRPNESWVRLSLLQSVEQNARALRHEQTHFDLTEVHARRLRRYFTELETPCAIPSDSLAEMAGRVAKDESIAQERYDADTDHGRNAPEQTRWERDVEERLAALRGFARQATASSLRVRMP